MKLLLFDQNISPRLVDRLTDIYPGSVHVFNLGLGNAMDIEIWQYAYDNDYMIVTKDADFSEFGIIKGFPPKIIWIRRGNCSTQEIETILRENYSAISELSEDPETGILTLF
jgi:predicted nuclease of predicted toxin-antitoxin system